MSVLLMGSGLYRMTAEILCVRALTHTISYVHVLVGERGMIIVY